MSTHLTPPSVPVAQRHQRRPVQRAFKGLAASPLAQIEPTTPQQRPVKLGRPPKLEGAKTSTERSRTHRQKEQIDKIVATGDTGGRKRNEVIGVDTELVHAMRGGQNTLLHRSDPTQSPAEMLLPDSNTLPDMPVSGDVRSRTGEGIGYESVGHDHDRDEPPDSDDDIKGEAAETESTFMRYIRFPFRFTSDEERQESYEHTLDFTMEHFAEACELAAELDPDEIEEGDENTPEESLKHRALLRCMFCEFGRSKQWRNGCAYIIPSGTFEATDDDWGEAVEHIQKEHKKELREYLAKIHARDAMKARPPKCSAADHDRMRLVIPPQTEGAVRCGVCKRVIFRSHISRKKLTNVRRSKHLKKDSADRGNLG